MVFWFFFKDLFDSKKFKLIFYKSIFSHVTKQVFVI